MALQYDSATGTFVAGPDNFNGGTVANATTFQASVNVDVDLDVDGNLNVDGTSHLVGATTIDGQTNFAGAKGRVLASSVFELDEQADPAAPAANKVRFYCKDNGAGKTQLVARFPTGAVQQVAIEP